ncbi:amino acid adenylation domain-containing protein [Umezawaea sp. Da 62-37]|uniref:amino acid adenylation domain-containing protein n=1 Tax=Umezawaea sp. Da 62-37 TaxID=3075927 RepID=UPI0028F6CFBD|nr:amino acid adenylation domain-containing protein [Umezawaea sp. Da 62-37]WNV88921.1 amino acid adenylation domain-containing protein [Umezawaea sp. Da 62-37]
MTDLATLFEARVDADPTRTAAEFGQWTWTYGELDARANRLANHLIEAGVIRGAFVGICADRRPDMVVAALAVLKAGAVYVPLDTELPADRLAWVIEDVDLAVVVTRRGLRPLLPATGTAAVLLDADGPQIAAASPARPRGQSATTAVCLTYTSGPTGPPKGVPAPQRGVLRLVVDAGHLPISPVDRVAFAARFAFDSALFEIWGALLNGACLIGVPEEVLASPRDLARFVRRSRISTMFLTTARFTEVVRADAGALASVAQLLVGDEPVDPAVLRAARARHGGTLLNCYGSAETTAFAVVHEVDEVAPDAESVPLGWAIDETPLYVLDELMRPVPDGTTGELYIGGSGVASGYWRRPSQTALAFMADPFAGRGGRMYRTGDLVTRRPNGLLDLVGRREGPAGIRGFRTDWAGPANGVRPGGPRTIARTVPDARVGESGVDEWRLGTLSLLSELPHDTVLEIGCGDGDVARDLVARTRRYVATDPSPAALDRFRARMTDDGRADDRLELVLAAADDLSAVGAALFDMVLVESVVQFFPHLDYLRRVLADVTARVRDGGVVVIADVRNLALLKHSCDPAEEDGLVVHPAWFRALAGAVDRIGHVEVRHKRGPVADELTRYRYDVVLHVVRTAAVEPVEWPDWGDAVDLERWAAAGTVSEVDGAGGRPAVSRRADA